MTVDAPAFALAAAAGPGRTFGGLPLTDGTVGYLAGEWDVAREIADHRTGQAGSFRGRASFRPVATGPVPATGSASPDRPVSQLALDGQLDQDSQPDQAGQPELDGRVLDFTEHGELRFGGHRGPASRALVYHGRSDGGADVRFANGREFYRIDLSYGGSQAAHPCHSDRYVVTVTRLSPDTFSEVWRVTGPAKDYDMTTVYTRAGRTR